MFAQQNAAVECVWRAVATLVRPKTVNGDAFHCMLLLIDESPRSSFTKVVAVRIAVVTGADPPSNFLGAQFQ